MQPQLVTLSLSHPCRPQLLPPPSPGGWLGSGLPPPHSLPLSPASRLSGLIQHPEDQAPSQEIPLSSHPGAWPASVTSPQEVTVGGWEGFPKGLGPPRDVGAGCSVPAALYRWRMAVTRFLRKCLLRSVFRGDSCGGLALSSHGGWQVARVCAVLVLASSKEFEPECPLYHRRCPCRKFSAEPIVQISLSHE